MQRALEASRVRRPERSPCWAYGDEQMLSALEIQVATTCRQLTVGLHLGVWPLRRYRQLGVCIR